MGGLLASQLLRFGSNLILTRLLLPEAFGVMTIATVLMVGVTMMSDVGLQQVVIRSANANRPEFTNTVWTLQVAQGVLIALVLGLMAALLSGAQAWRLLPPDSTYASPVLPVAMGGLALVSLISGFNSTNFQAAAKRLQLGKVTFIELGSQVAGLLVMLWCTSFERSVLALVAGAVATSAFRVVMGHLLLSGALNGFCFQQDAAAEIFCFGKWIFVTSGVAFLLGSLDKLLLSWFFPADAVGKYAIASLLIMALHDLIHRLSARVAFPALSASYLRDKSSLKLNYYRVRLPIDALCLMSAGALMISGQRVVDVLYDDRYAEAGSHLQALALTLVGVRFAVLGQVFIVMGKTRLLMYEQFARMTSLLVGFTLGFHFEGMTGAVWGVSASYLAGSIVNLGFLQPRLGLADLRGELLAIPMLGAGMAVGLAVDRFL